MLPQRLSKCSLASLKSDRASSESCLAKQYIDLVSSKIGSNADYKSVLNKLGCKDDHCVIVKSSNMLPKESSKEKLTAFKIDGPTDKKLLNNYNIDTTLKQWEAKFDGTAKENDSIFFAYNFNMKEFKTKSWSGGKVINEPDTLESIKFEDLYYAEKPIHRKGEIVNDRKFNCAGCVVNTDSYYGGGKHWMAFFLDWRDPHSGWTVEFFNSSGNNPASHWVEFMTSMTSQMRNIATKEGINPPISQVVVNRRQMQKSKTECGLYSLFYIWSRINKFPYTHFQKYQIRDKYMYEFRQHIFNGTPPAVLNSDGSFNWDAFKSSHKLEWESGTTEQDKA